MRDTTDTRAQAANDALLWWMSIIGTGAFVMFSVSAVLWSVSGMIASAAFGGAWYTQFVFFVILAVPTAVVMSLPIHKIRNSESTGGKHD